MTQQASPIQPVILCGGSGTRLWPLSRRLYPKQFMETGQGTLFGETLERTASVTPEPALVVCNEEQRFLAAAILAEYSQPGPILLEPEGRNTAPAIALAALAASEQGADPLLLVLPSDHRILPVSGFAESVARAVPLAENGFLVTFGVEPQYPATGYGYIKTGEAMAGGFAVSRFVEKPDASTASAMLSEGGYFWNSGIFLFRASRFLEELDRFEPEISAACALAWKERTPDLGFIRVRAEDFGRSPAISVDYAVMERTARAAMVPMDASWSDLGSWSAFYDIAPKDDRQNALIGDVIARDVAGSYLHASSRLLAAVGVRNLAVVETADAVLVAPLERVEETKAIVEELQRFERAEKDTHVRVLRPWGSYEVLAQGPRFQVKRIQVKQGASLSLQKHRQRAEHWVVVSGRAEVTVGQETKTLHEDESVYIPMGTVHRLANVHDEPLVIIETQTGSYLGEDDIIRLSDDYGR